MKEFQDKLFYFSSFFLNPFACGRVRNKFQVIIYEVYMQFPQFLKNLTHFPNKFYNINEYVSKTKIA